MRKFRRKFLTVILPAFLLLPLILLMAGCIYIPWFPQHSYGAKVESSIGSPDSSRPLRLMVATRSQVHSILGPPDYVSSNSRSDGYQETKSYGFWVAPLCFTAVPAFGQERIARLTFNDQDQLIEVKWASDRDFITLFPQGVKPDDVPQGRVSIPNNTTKPATTQK